MAAIGISDRARHPSGSSIGPTGARALAAPISRPLVKSAEHFFGSASCQIYLSIFANYRVRTAPVSSVDGCDRISDRARHPSGSSIGPTGARALAA